MEKVNVRVPKFLLEKIDKIVKKGYYSNVSEFIRDAIREKLKEFEEE